MSRGQLAAGTWSLLDTMNVSFAVGNDGTLYDLEANGSLWQRTTPGWAKMQSNIQLISLGVDDITISFK